MSGRDWTLCIDFGTAYSKAAAAPVDAWNAFDPGSVRPLMLGEGGVGANAFLLNSAVFIEEGRVYFGRPALARAEALASQRRMALRSFKTLLSVSDLERGLNTSAPGSIDPSRTFTMGDLILLYLAYLWSAIDRAIGADAVLSGANSIALRYAAPAWRAGDSAGLHEIVVGLFGAAQALAETLGPARLLASRGVGADEALKALAVARAEPAPCAMGLIFEATGACAYGTIGLDRDASHMIVVDMGAGTTDIAALARNNGRLHELQAARLTLKQAGDFVDSVIGNLTLKSCSWAKSPAQQAEVWNAALRAARDIKESLFFDGRAALRVNGRTVKLGMRDLERHADFRDFMQDLAQAYEQGLEAVCSDALGRGRKEVHAIAVGGGAYAPFIQNLLRTKPRRGRIKVKPRSATPEWAHTGAFDGNLAPVFPQLAIAIGGSLAPEEMLAAKAAVS